MSRFSIRLSLATLLATSLALPSLAGDRAAVVMADRPARNHRALQRFKECLSILDLQPDQKADIEAILDAAKPTVDADRAAVKTDREKLRQDSNTDPVDPCVVGKDFLTLRTDAKSLRDEVRSVIDQIESGLTPDQKAKLEGCLQAPKDTAAAGTSAASD